jgi:hypothetical protein
VCLNRKDALETSHRHKREHNVEQEVNVNELSTVNVNDQTTRGKQVLNEMTKKAISNDKELNEK